MEFKLNNLQILSFKVGDLPSFFYQIADYEAQEIVNQIKLTTIIEINYSYQIHNNIKTDIHVQPAELMLTANTSEQSLYTINNTLYLPYIQNKIFKQILSSFYKKSIFIYTYIYICWLSEQRSSRTSDQTRTQRHSQLSLGNKSNRSS